MKLAFKHTRVYRFAQLFCFRELWIFDLAPLKTEHFATLPLMCQKLRSYVLTTRN